jgi:hypothetical protein
MKKSETKKNWRNFGIKFTEEEFEFIYGVYINTLECMICSKVFTRPKERHLDHDHATGEPRYVCCQKCNKGMDLPVRKDNKFGEKYIQDRIIDGKEYYQIVYKKQTKTFRKTKYSLQTVIEERDKILKNLSI